MISENELDYDVVKMYKCAGCQTCLSVLNDPGDTRAHYIHSEIITDSYKQLLESNKSSEQIKENQ